MPKLFRRSKKQGAPLHETTNTTPIHGQSGDSTFSPDTARLMSSIEALHEAHMVEEQPPVIYENHSRNPSPTPPRSVERTRKSKLLLVSLFALVVCAAGTCAALLAALMLDMEQPSPPPSLGVNPPLYSPPEASALQLDAPRPNLSRLPAPPVCRWRWPMRCDPNHCRVGFRWRPLPHPTCRACDH